MGDNIKLSVCIMYNLLQLMVINKQWDMDTSEFSHENNIWMSGRGSVLNVMTMMMMMMSMLLQS